MVFGIETDNIQVGDRDSLGTVTPRHALARALAGRYRGCWRGNRRCLGTDDAS